MNQKSRNALYAGLGTVFAVMLANPAIAYAGTWSNEGGPNQWKYYTDDNTSAADGWYWIDGDQDGLEECYYFDKNGFMMADTRTPDGFQVNSDGFWTVSGQVQKRETPVQDFQPDFMNRKAGLSTATRAASSLRTPGEARTEAGTISTLRVMPSRDGSILTDTNSTSMRMLARWSRTLRASSLHSLSRSLWTVPAAR